MTKLLCQKVEFSLKHCSRLFKFRAYPSSSKKLKQILPGITVVCKVDLCDNFFIAKSYFRVPIFTVPTKTT